MVFRWPQALGFKHLRLMRELWLLSVLCRCRCGCGCSHDLSLTTAQQGNYMKGQLSRCAFVHDFITCLLRLLSCWPFEYSYD